MLKSDTLKIRETLCCLFILAATTTSHAANDDRGKIAVDLASTLLVMGRDYGNGNSGTSASASLSISAKTALSPDLALGLKGVLVQNMFEDGKKDAAYWLSNDTSNTLTEAYLSYRTRGLGIEQTEFNSGPYRS